MEQQHPSSGTIGTRLVHLLELGLASGKSQGETELAAELDYYLGLPLEAGLGRGHERVARQIRASAESSRSTSTTLLTLFLQSAPSPVLLVKAKDFAKASLRSRAPFLPKEIAGVIYYISIGTALIRLNQRISDLSDKELCRGFDWALELKWLDPRLRECLVNARKVLGEL